MLLYICRKQERTWYHWVRVRDNAPAGWGWCIPSYLCPYPLEQCGVVLRTRSQPWGRSPHGFYVISLLITSYGNCNLQNLNLTNTARICYNKTSNEGGTKQCSLSSLLMKSSALAIWSSRPKLWTTAARRGKRSAFTLRIPTVPLAWSWIIAWVCALCAMIRTGLTLYEAKASLYFC